MNWQDEGFVLSVRKHGESSAIVNLLTESYGRYAGFVRGGASKKQQATYQIGNMVEAKWNSRIDDALGAYSCDVLHSYPAIVMSDSLKLACIVSACDMANNLLPEREPMAFVFHAMQGLLDDVTNTFADNDGRYQYAYLETYVLWEMVLLNALGFGLDLDKCAVTGKSEKLLYVSPKTGRAVSASAGEEWKNKLLYLPNFIAHRVGAGRKESAPDKIKEIISGLELTGYFIRKHVLSINNSDFPQSRGRLVNKIKKL